MLNWFFKPKQPQTSWSANAYLTADRLVIHTRSRTHNNVGWYNQPVFQLSTKRNTGEIGSQLRSALNASVWDSRTNDAQIKPHPVVVAAGFSTWDALEKNSRLVNVESDKQWISIIPCRAANRAEGQGFIVLDQKFSLCWDATDAEIGDMLMSAFQCAT